MSVIEAMYAVAYGYTVKSCVGNTYTEAELQPRLICRTVVSYNSILSDDERKGRWEIVEDSDVLTDDYF